jgi:RNA polymerase sigma-70 factor (sigma-E family)
MGARRAATPAARMARSASAARSDEAFADAVVQHHKSLTRFAYILCGNSTQAEDAVAEAYARVWPRWRRGRVDNLFGYLRRSVANEIYGRHRRFRLELREAQRPPDRHDDGQFETEVSDRDALWAALGHLTPRLRVVVVLRIVEDLSESETADMLGIPAGTVKSRLSRALAILRSAVEAVEALEDAEDAETAETDDHG